DRMIFIGPQAQEALRPYLLRDKSAYCFSPSDSERKRLSQQHAERTTPASHGNSPGTNRKRNPKRVAGMMYTKDSYYQAVKRACIKAK
ncbi:MAG: site-specific integrase, partial [Planctomycetaceae bacterium]